MRYLVHHYLLLITVAWRPRFFRACLADGIGLNVTNRRFGAWPLIQFRSTTPSLEAPMVGAITMRRVGDPDTRYHVGRLVGFWRVMRKQERTRDREKQDIE
jgi:hypothetical protein